MASPGAVRIRLPFYVSGRSFLPLSEGRQIAFCRNRLEAEGRAGIGFAREVAYATNDEPIAAAIRFRESSP